MVHYLGNIFEFIKFKFSFMKIKLLIKDFYFSLLLIIVILLIIIFIKLFYHTFFVWLGIASCRLNVCFYLFIYCCFYLFKIKFSLWIFLKSIFLFKVCVQYHSHSISKLCCSYLLTAVYVIIFCGKNLYS